MEILLLEDDANLRFAFQQALENQGYNVCAVGTIDEAAVVLQHISPRLLILDLMIGRQYSIQIADLAGYSAPNAEVIYVTGSNRFPNGELFQLSVNATWVLRKPVDLTELVSLVAHISVSSLAGRWAEVREEVVA